MGKWFISGVLVVFALGLTGCVSTIKKGSEDTQALQNQVSALEAQVKAKDEEIAALKDEMAKPEASQVLLVANPNAKQIQSALKNAGYYTGNIDGKIGRMTVKAIKAFQKDSNLTVDGKVGKQTWALLVKFLEPKVK